MYSGCIVYLYIFCILNIYIRVTCDAPNYGINIYHLHGCMVQIQLDLKLTFYLLSSCIVQQHVTCCQLEPSAEAKQFLSLERHSQIRRSLIKICCTILLLWNTLKQDWHKGLVLVAEFAFFFWLYVIIINGQNILRIGHLRSQRSKLLFF